jgi:hypothetical protein
LEWLRLQRDVYADAIAHARIGGDVTDLLPEDPPYSPAVNEYLRLAYFWFADDNRCSGDKPTELWRYLAEQTGNSRDAPREAFKRRDPPWYDPNPPFDPDAPEDAPTPAEYVRQQVMREGSTYFQ